MSNPLNEWSEVNDHLKNIVNYLKGFLPKQVCVDVHGGRFSEDDLKQYATKAPALKVSLLRLRVKTAKKPIDINTLESHKPIASEMSHAIVNMTIGITVVTKDMGSSLPRYEAAVNLSQFLFMVLPHQTFGTNHVSPVPADIDLRNLFNVDVDKNKKVAFWGVAFDQKITIPIPKYVSHIPQKLFWANHDDININDYKPLEG